MRSWEIDIFRDLLSKIITAKAENRKYGVTVQVSIKHVLFDASEHEQGVSKSHLRSYCERSEQ